MKKAFKLLREVKSSVISTAVDGKAHARIIDIMHYDETGLYFITLPTKPFYRELEANPAVAITAMSSDYVQVRVEGTVEKLDLSMIESIVEKNPALLELFSENSKNFVPFKLSKGKGEWFDLSGRERKVIRERFAFGGETVRPPGLTINDLCTECGICQQVCPFSAVEPGSPFTIVGQYCDECGICYSACPVGAIELPTGM